MKIIGENIHIVSPRVKEALAEKNIKFFQHTISGPSRSACRFIAAPSSKRSPPRYLTCAFHRNVSHGGQRACRLAAAALAWCGRGTADTPTTAIDRCRTSAFCHRFGRCLRSGSSACRKVRARRRWPCAFRINRCCVSDPSLPTSPTPLPSYNNWICLSAWIPQSRILPARSAFRAGFCCRPITPTGAG